MSPAILLFAAALLGSDSQGSTPQAVPPTSPASPTTPAPAKAANPRVALETSLGKIVIELDPAKAPKTVENFLGYVKSGFYDGTIFHRVIPGFMIQGGGFTADMKQKTTQAPIPNEADNGLKNKRGTLSMARTNDPMSATSQFFVNVNDNRSLDSHGEDGGWLGLRSLRESRRRDGGGRQDRQREARQSRTVRRCAGDHGGDQEGDAPAVSLDPRAPERCGNEKGGVRGSLRTPPLLSQLDPPDLPVLPVLRRVVPNAGLEPARVTPHAPQTCASTNSASSASLLNIDLSASLYG